MNYVQRVLQPDETLVYSTTVHWSVYLRAALFAIVALALLIGSQFAPQDEPAMATALLVAAGVVGIITLWFWLGAFIQRATTEFAVTSRRVIYKAGLIRRRTFEMNLGAVESVDVNQSILGRILGFGEVRIHGVGGSWEPYPLISDPLTFRSHITARPV
ncbi:MAG TPA: PH domain-containing protein [Acetobacteraceae bacterium]|jgi:uncharacterized membrane protein YdbT with pleckstrin-like domain|nr:PH domain-containing protein [Acetobacteraceae bacterium]